MNIESDPEAINSIPISHWENNHIESQKASPFSVTPQLNSYLNHIKKAGSAIQNAVFNTKELYNCYPKKRKILEYPTHLKNHTIRSFLIQEIASKSNQY